MQVAWHRDHDQLDLGVGQQVVELDVGTAAEALLGLGAPLGQVILDRDHGEALGLLGEQPRVDAPAAATQAGDGGAHGGNGRTHDGRIIASAGMQWQSGRGSELGALTA